MRRAVLATVVLSVVACRGEEGARPAPPAPAAASEVEADAAEEPASAGLECELARQRFVLRDGRWVGECLAEPLARNSSVWTTDGRRVATVVNIGCEVERGEQTLVVLDEQGRQRRHDLGLQRRLGRGSSIVFRTPDELLVVPGEHCGEHVDGMELYTFELTAARATRHRHINGGEVLWPRLLVRDGEVDWLPPYWDALSFRGTWANTDLASTYGCTQLWPPPSEFRGCQYPSALYTDSKLHARGAWSLTRFTDIDPDRRDETRLQSYAVGTGLTWAYDAHTGYAAFVGGIDAPEQSRLTYFALTPYAWAIHRRRPPRRLPLPPVQGDGVELVYDPGRLALVLLDPAAERSWVLRDYRRWDALEHQPLASLRERIGEPIQSPPDDGRPLAWLHAPPNRAELDTQRPVVWRNTDHVAPWFAYYDTTLETFVVYPLEPEAAFCLPVHDAPEQAACLSSHT